MEQRKWAAFFSQTGGEIVEISRALGRWPDVIVTNKRPEHLREISSEIPKELLVELPNRPSVEDYKKVLPKGAVTTLHGWLRILPEEICNEYKVYNGHPGLITWYPELKGKDPQIRAYEGIKSGKYKVAGAVLHKVTAGVDEGEVLMEEKFNAFQLELDDLFRILRNRSMYMWYNFLKTVL